MRITTRFPILDAPRDYANDEFHRGIHDVHGFVDPYIGETDSWIAMPVRLVHDEAGGWHLELGPYDLGRADIETLRAAIFAFDDAAGPVNR